MRDLSERELEQVGGAVVTTLELPDRWKLPEPTIPPCIPDPRIPSRAAALGPGPNLSSSACDGRDRTRRSRPSSLN